MASSLSNLVNNISKEIHKIKCKHGHSNKKSEIFRIKYKHCNCFLELANFKDDLIEYKYLCCNNNYEQNFDEKLNKQYFNIYKYSNHDVNDLFYW